MTDQTSQALRFLINTFPKTDIAKTFLARLREGALTRDENPDTHFCVYFAGYDPVAREVFLGHHIKSGLWLFNGGHIDQGETPTEALIREIREEWGARMNAVNIDHAKLLTLTRVLPSPNVHCTHHYDIWYFVRLDRKTFTPDQTLLAKEFHQTRWLSPTTARRLASDPNTHEAIDHIEKNFFTD